MKLKIKNKIVVSIFFLLFLLYGCGGKPVIFFEKEEYDIGKVARGQRVKKEIFIYNRGSGLLKIKRIATDCHCTVAKGIDTEIEPNGKGKIEIVYDGKSFGYFEQIIEVFSNDKEHSPIMLILKGRVK